MKLNLRVLLILFLPAVLMSQELIDVEGGGMTYTLFTSDRQDTNTIEVDDFQIASTEVTVLQWKEFIDFTGREFSWTGHYCGDIAELSPLNECPIQLVELIDAIHFCNWLSRQNNLTQVYYFSGGRIRRIEDANGYRLPTPAEWDFAARGGNGSLGYRYSGSNEASQVAWYGEPGNHGTQPVGTKKANELGLFDMSGNIREWVWIEGGISESESENDGTTGMRGGSWTSPLEKLDLAYVTVVKIYQSSCNGFRLARNAPPD